MPLSETALRALKPSDRTRKVFDERGLYIEVTPTGGKWWRFKYRSNGKENRLSLGTYPDVTLKSARAKRDDMRSMLTRGTDPGAVRRAKRDAVEERTFEAVAREFVLMRSKVLHPDYAALTLRRMDMYVFPHLGTTRLEDVTAPALLAVLRHVEARAVETSHRLLQLCGQVFRYGIATGRCERDIAADLRGALQPRKVEHLPAMTNPVELAGLLRAIDGYRGTPVVKTALKLAPLTFTRPGELRHARWADFDLDLAEWRFEASKTNQQHLVPLSAQAVALLQELRPLTGRGEWVFPSPVSYRKPMSDNAVLTALRRMDIPKEEMTGHGFRAIARTILDEVLGFRVDLIEHQLAHAVRDPNGRAYNRTAHLPERRRMMQVWADYLEGLRR